MKNFKIISVFILLFAFSNNYNAQFSNWLKQKKEELNQKINDKINEKSSEAINKAVEMPEKVIQKKIDKKKLKSNKNFKQDSSEETSESSQNDNNQPIEVENEAPSENGETVFQTNIKCAKGKNEMMKILKKKKGVSHGAINIQNGELKLEYNSDGTPYTKIIELINENGFDADGNISKTKKNACN